MLATQVSAVKNAIKTIGAKVSAFQIFYYTQKEKSLEDYNFVSALPTFVKLPLQNNSINTKQTLVLMQTIDETVLYFNSHFTKPKELNYMLYHLFNNITDVKEIEEIKSNIVKLPKKAN
ncbi:hypothetical protein [Spiroplasma endosymbiont of Nebria brevicollis]|uniref:hypothetical protein n=1 Tax=Spiroplasma endosymbiont of Nebria brevicollis TaxID=3066284 RepID=UPI00313ED12E